MDDNKKVEEVAVQKEVEVDTTQVESPETKEAITEPKTTAEESVDQVSSTEMSDELPASEEERRRAFQQMRKELKQLKEEKRIEPEQESAFSSFRQQIPQVSQPGPVRIEDFQDPLTGETNLQAYNHAVNEKIAVAGQNAAFAAQQTAQEIIDENNARQKYPELFSDPITEKRMAAQWLFEKVQGRNTPVSKIAEEFARDYKRTVTKAEKIGAEKALTEVSEKETAGLSTEGQTSTPAKRDSSIEEHENLVSRTRLGDDEAIAARISKIPWANK